MMTANELYRSLLRDLLVKYSAEEASNISSLVFEHVTGIDLPALVREPGRIVTTASIDAIHKSLVALQNDQPVQYITGEAWFYHMRLKVSPAVLIPRPETEELAEAAIGFLQQRPGASVVDIGTGSGCIAIAIKKQVKTTLVTAIDVSAEALSIAKQNALDQQTEINFRQVDFLQKENHAELEKYDLVISNPPYIPQAEAEKMERNVTVYEPHLALFVADEQPLIFYEMIAEFGKIHLKENGMILVETHEDLAEAVAALFNRNAYNTSVKKDIFGKQRMLMATHYR